MKSEPHTDMPSDEEVRNALQCLDAPLSPWKALPFAFQHVLAMLVSNIVPMTLIALLAVPAVSEADILILIQNAMAAAGLATLLQTFPIGRIGSGLPIFMGVSFTFVVPLAAVSSKYGYGAVIGTVLAGGIFEGILGFSAKYWKRLITPIVSAVVVTGIGLSLLPTAARSFGGGNTPDYGSLINLLIGSATLLSCILWRIYAKGVHKQLSVLVGLAVGYLLAVITGNVYLHDLLDSGLIAVPRLLPFQPLFRLDAILSVCVIYLVSATETIGDASALTSGALERQISGREVSGAIAADGFGSVLAGLFGITPITSYSENVGITIMTRVVNREKSH
ncbi:MAG: purine permease [Solobacterium sp.]|nr:purine permease [Solobacterium sp.]